MARTGLLRMLLLVGSLSLGLLAAEGALRLRYPDLPSVAPLAASGLSWREGEVAGDCHLSVVDRLQPPVEFVVAGPAPELRLWFAGDSTTHGSGLRGQEAWWFHVTAALAARAGRGARGTNLAVPGASYCGTRLQVLEQAATAPPPDLVLVGVFADDLVQHELLSVEGRVVLLPAAAPAWLRPLVTRSYLANLGWLALDSRRVSARGRQLDPQALPGFRAAMATLRDWGAANDVAVAAVLIPPVGIASCRPGEAPDHPCTWMPADLAAMAGELASLGMPVVDLRPRFAQGDLGAVASDQRRVEQGQDAIPIHADAAANAALAEEIVLRLVALGLAR